MPPFDPEKFGINRNQYDNMNEIVKFGQDKMREQLGRQKQTTNYEEAQRFANQYVEKTFLSPEAQEIQRQNLINKRQRIVQKMMQITQDFMSGGSQSVASQGSTLPSTFATGSVAAQQLGRMGGMGMGSAGFASLGMIVSVVAVVSFCYIVVVFGMAISKVAEEDRKKREKLEEQLKKELLEWEKNHKQMPPSRGRFLPRVAR